MRLHNIPVFRSYYFMKFYKREAKKKKKKKIKKEAITLGLLNNFLDISHHFGFRNGTQEHRKGDREKERETLWEVYR